MRTFLLVALAASVQAQVPRTWTQSAVDSLELPLANPKFSPVHISEEAYYRIPERVIYRSYPVYAPGREPNGYMDRLKSLDPEVAFKAARLKTRAQWLDAGALVFNMPTSFSPVFFTAGNLRDPEFYNATGMPVAKDGTVPFARWVIRRKGTVEMGSMGCNTCHTRVLQNGLVVEGGPGNNPNDRQGALLLRTSAKAIGPEKVTGRVREFARQFEAPWLQNDINGLARSMLLEEFIAAGEAIPPGVSARANTSMFLPPQIPDLIGVRDRAYLDHTGLIRHREIGDLMRYSSLSQDVFTQDRYGPNSGEPSGPPAVRYSDQQLYALALFLEALAPPPNPNQLDSAASRGRSIFMREQCANCHPPPLYTNNKLLPVQAFDPPRGGMVAVDIMPIKIGTDARYTLGTRKGTGYYKVPSLKGLWYRGPFGHNGAAATLEDWFDPARLNPDYVPTGFKGYDGKDRSIPGHPYGLQLPLTTRRELVAFLKTL